jgi:two-component system sensor histidine kinase AlgZ
VSEAVFYYGRYWEEQLGFRSGLFPSAHWSFLLPKLGIALIVGALALRYFYVASQWRQSVELEARATVRSLQARIRPHFLFNSLNAIAALTRTDPLRAEGTIEYLADLLRVSLIEGRSQITLRAGLEVAHTYQRIEQLRLGDRLAVQWDLDDVPFDALVPSLLLQPLLENAVGHGIEPLPEGGTVTVLGRVDGSALVLEVSNPVAPDRRPPPWQPDGARQHPPAAGAGISRTVIRRRARGRRGLSRAAEVPAEPVQGPVGRGPVTRTCSVGESRGTMPQNLSQANPTRCVR